MKTILSTLVVMLLCCKCYQSPEIEDLDRFLREISVENSAPEARAATIINDSTQIDGKSDDPDADKFIEELKNLANGDGKNTTKSQDSLPKKAPISFESVNNKTLNTYPHLMYITKLNGSSFRVKISINQSWSRDLLYPSNYQYASTESDLAKTFNKLFEEYEDFVNFHILSFNYRTNDSYFCDFILNFKSKNEHLKPLLGIIISGKLGRVPIMLDDFQVYVIEINPANIESCPKDCEKLCDKTKCPIDCCLPKKTDPKTAETTTTVPPKVLNEHNDAPDMVDWGANASDIQDEVMKMMKDLALNNSQLEERQLTSNQGTQEISNLQGQRTFSDFGLPHNSYQQSSTEYQLPSFPVPQMNVLDTYNSFYQPTPVEKRVYIPQAPNYRDSYFKSPMQITIPLSTTNLNPSISSYNKNFHLYYPNTEKQQNFMANREGDSSRSGQGNNYRIWFPKL